MTRATCVVLSVLWFALVPGYCPARDSDTVATEVYPKLLKGCAWVLNPQGWTGTAWVVDRERRLLITNEHVTTTSRTVSLIFPRNNADGDLITEKKHYQSHADELRITGQVIDIDVGRDLALIQAASLPAEVQALPLAKKSATPGQRVHSIGNPGVSAALWVYTSGRARKNEAPHRTGKMVRLKVAGVMSARSTRPSRRRFRTLASGGSGSASARAAMRAARAGSRVNAMPPPQVLRGFRTWKLKSAASPKVPAGWP